jgi:hypothetical protein
VLGDSNISYDRKWIRTSQARGEGLEVAIAAKNLRDSDAKEGVVGNIKFFGAVIARNIGIPYTYVSFDALPPPVTRRLTRREHHKDCHGSAATL